MINDNNRGTIGDISNNGAEQRKSNSNLEVSAFGKSVKKHLVEKELNLKPIGYGTNTEVKLIKFQDRIIVEKTCTDHRFNLSHELEVSQQLARHPEMSSWFVPINGRFAKHEDKELFGEIQNEFVGWSVHMDPCLTGSLANIVTENMRDENSESSVEKEDYEYSEHKMPNISLEQSAAHFYLANAALIISKMHKSGVAWLDVKPENLLIDDEGYLIACDFGTSKCLNEENKTNHKDKDWKDLGRRVGNYAFQLLLTDSPLHEVVKLLESGKIHSIKEFKKLDAFSDFNWSDLELRNLKAPYTEMRRKLLSKYLSQSS